MIGAVFYSREEHGDLLLSQVADYAVLEGFKVIGFVQANCESDMCSKDIMELRDIETQNTINICLDLGENAAKACRLNPAAMAEASQTLAVALNQPFDLCILNKFGKAEAEAEGFLNEITRCVELEKPLLIGVPKRFEKAFISYSEGFYETLPFDLTFIKKWLTTIR